MKIRNGFVSNSSSSSFVAIGIKKIDDCNCGTITTHSTDPDIEILYVDSDDYDYIEGIILNDNDYLNEKYISIIDFHKLAEKVADSLNIGIEHVELIMGTHSF